MAAGASSGNQQKLSVPAGSQVSCTTRNGEKIEGEVLAYDNQYKIIVLKLPGSSGEKGTCDINFLNADLLQDFNIVEEAKKSPGQLPPLDMTKICQRTEQNLLRKQRQTDRIGVGVSLMAQNLFDVVSKPFNNCQWDGQDICIKDVDVKIMPPYKPDNIVGDPEGIDYVKKIVEKFYAEQATTF